MKTISRILKKGGRAVVTFPFNNGEYIEEECPEGVGYFQRRYNITAIKDRIIVPSKLAVKKVLYFGERFIKVGQLYRQNRFSRVYWLIPFFHPLFWRIVHSYEGEFRDYHEMEIDKKGVGVACVVLEKD
jgi:hypothetical protein